MLGHRRTSSESIHVVVCHSPDFSPPDNVFESRRFVVHSTKRGGLPRETRSDIQDTPENVTIELDRTSM